MSSKIGGIDMVGDEFVDDITKEEFRQYAKMSLLERIKFLGQIPWNQTQKYYEFNKLLKKLEL